MQLEQLSKLFGSQKERMPLPPKGTGGFFNAFSRHKKFAVSERKEEGMGGQAGHVDGSLCRVCRQAI